LKKFIEIYSFRAYQDYSSSNIKILKDVLPKNIYIGKLNLSMLKSNIDRQIASNKNYNKKYLRTRFSIGNQKNL